MAETIDSIPLRSISNPSLQGTQEQNGQADSRPGDHVLERVDGGRSAWLMLCAAFIFEAVLWGFPLSFGVFQPYYMALPEFEGSHAITYVGIVATGITYMGAPIVVPFIRSFPKYQRPMMLFGWALCIIGLVAGSFASTVPTLIATQGVMYGIGYLLVFFPIINMMNEWWVARRGFAWGIMAGSSGASGVAYPFIIESLLSKYGYQTTLRVLAIAAVILTAPLLPALRNRVPISQTTALAPMDWTFLRKPAFWSYAIATSIQSLGFYLPGLYLPSYAATLGLSARVGALLVALLSIAQLLGQITYGYLSDSRLPLNLLLASTCAIAATASLTLWGLAKSSPPLVVFALIYGFFAYAFMAMRVRMGTAVDPAQSASLPMFCIFSFAQGIGNILAAPISGALLSGEVDPTGYGVARFEPLIVFTGCSMAAGAGCIVLSSWLRRVSFRS